MKKLFYLLQLIILLGFTACSGEDSFEQVKQQPTTEVTLKANLNKSLIIKPNITRSGAQYEWYVNGEYVSSDSQLNFLSNKTGRCSVVLKTIVNGTKTVTLYTVNTIISLVSELNDFTLNSTNGVATTGGYYWNQTYSNNKFQTANFIFSHTGGAVSGYNYWDGFTVSNSTDNSNYGTTSSSDGWINHQWGCMPGGGYNDSPNFLIGYWGYYMLDNQSGLTTFSESGFSNWVKLGSGTTTYQANNVKVAIHPWPYYGILSGDGFARAFTTGDYFVLKIYGVNSSNQIVGPVNYYLADYRTSTHIMSTDWNEVNVSSLGAIKYLMFQLKSTDSDPTLGPNTAVYFCLGDIEIQ